MKFDKHDVSALLKFVICILAFSAAALYYIVHVK
jgi:hypothetical protein